MIASALKLATVRSEGAATSLRSSFSFCIASTKVSSAAITLFPGRTSPFGKVKSGFVPSALKPILSVKNVSSIAITN